MLTHCRPAPGCVRRYDNNSHDYVIQHCRPDLFTLYSAVHAVLQMIKVAPDLVTFFNKIRTLLSYSSYF